MKKLLMLLLVCPFLNGMDLVPYSSKENLKVLAKAKDIYVEDENASYRIPGHQQNTLLREVLKRNAMSKFISEDGDGYVRVDKNVEGKYLLAAKVRGKGGTGPITAGIVGFVVRFGCYTGYLLGASGTVVAGTAIAGPAGSAAAGTAVATALAGAGGAAGVIAATETVAMKATLATLLLPIPLP